MKGLLKGRRIWHQGFLLSCEDLSRKLCVCCFWSSTHRGNQYAQLRYIRAIDRPSPPDHEEPVARNGGLLCSSTHHFRAMETLREDNRISKETAGFGQWSNKNTPMDCSVRRKHASTDCYSNKVLITTTPEFMSTSSSDAWSRSLPKTLACVAASVFKHSSGHVGSVPHMRRACSGVWLQRRRRDPLWIERRSLSYALKSKPASAIEAEIPESTSALRTESLSTIEAEIPESTSALRTESLSTIESEIPESASEVLDWLAESKDEDFDFRNFPALTSSFFQDYVRPREMESKKRVMWLTRRKLSDAESKLTMDSIPAPSSRPYDFGLGDKVSKPPPLEAGARPQGGFDIDIPTDEYEGADPVRPTQAGAIPLHMSGVGKLPWNTPDAEEDQSEIFEDPQHSVSQGDDQDLDWNLEEFDESVDVLRIF